MRRAIEDTPADAWLTGMKCARAWVEIGSKFAELGTIIRESGSERVKVCVDTQHASPPATM
jgi:endonuclease IV